jgi:hypothetical protein
VEPRCTFGRPAGRHEWGLEALKQIGSGAERRPVRSHRASHSDSLVTQSYATLHPIASVTVLRPECKLNAAEKARAE